MKNDKKKKSIPMSKDDLMEAIYKRDQIIEEYHQREKIVLKLLKESLRRELHFRNALDEISENTRGWFQTGKYVDKNCHNDGEAFVADAEVIVVNALYDIGKVVRGEF